MVRADGDIMAGGGVAGGVGVMRELGVEHGAELAGDVVAGGGVAKVPYDLGCTTPVSPIMSNKNGCPGIAHITTTECRLLSLRRLWFDNDGAGCTCLRPFRVTCNQREYYCRGLAYRWYLHRFDNGAGVGLFGFDRQRAGLSNTSTVHELDLIAIGGCAAHHSRGELYRVTGPGDGT